MFEALPKGACWEFWRPNVENQVLLVLELTKETSEKTHRFSIVLIEDLRALEVKAAVILGHFQATDGIESISQSLNNMKPARGEAVWTLEIDDLSYKVHLEGQCGSLAWKDYRLRVRIWVYPLTQRSYKL